MEKIKDYGCDPLGDGMFRLVPSGDVVNFEESCRRLPLNNPKPRDGVDGVFGLTWDQIEAMQGGKLKR